MADWEKVMKGLECCSKYVGDECQSCPYDSVCEPKKGERNPLMMDAISLLKVQEPVKPSDETCNWWDQTWGRCGHCNAYLPMLEGLKSKFCWMCGRPVKWDDI